MYKLYLQSRIKTQASIELSQKSTDNKKVLFTLFKKLADANKYKNF